MCLRLGKGTEPGESRGGSGTGRRRWAGDTEGAHGARQGFGQCQWASPRSGVRAALGSAAYFVLSEGSRELLMIFAPETCSEAE